MDLSQPFSGMLLNKIGSLVDVIWLVSPKIPFDFSKFTFIQKLMWKVFRLNFIVKIVVFSRRDEVEEKLTKFVVNWMIFEEFKIRYFSAGFLGENLTNNLEGILILFFEGLVNYLKDVCKV
jgi:hypothetical protein